MRAKRELRTAPGHLYVAATSPAGPVKVGVAGNPKKRLRALECAVGARFAHVWVSPLRPSVRDVEALAHRRMAAERGVGEWFNVPFSLAVDVAKELTGVRRRRRRVQVVHSAPAPVMPSEQAESAMDRVARAALPLFLAFLEHERGA